MLTKTCEEFINVLSSKEPVPGGGGAAALAGALGCALEMMVGNLTIGKKKYADAEADIIELNVAAKKLQDRLRALVNKDAKAFEPLSAVYRMPKDTEDERAAREKAMQDCLLDAAMVPLEIAECSLFAARLLLDYADKGSTLAISDVGCAAAMLRASMESAKLNVLINTKMMKDESRRDDIENKIQDIVNEGISLTDRAFAAVEGRLTSA